MMEKNSSLKFVLVILTLILVVSVYFNFNNSMFNYIPDILIIISSLIVYVKAPKLTGLSEENIKNKVIKQSIILVLFIVLGKNIIDIFNLNLLFSENINRNITIITVSIIILFIGNSSPKIPFNRNVGLRLPWTIADEETWRLAHKVLGYLTFPIILPSTILALIFNKESIIAFAIILLVFIPSLYSFRFYYNKSKSLK